ncbi:hypothetical protein ACJX0J_000714 [Zea mays]
MSNKPQYRLLEFGLSKKPWYRILIVNFYTELENYMLKEFNWLKRIIEVTLNPLLLGFKKRIKINKKKFHNKSLDSELGTHNLSFGFLFFYLESAFKTKKKRKSFSIPNNFLVISCFWSHIIKEGKDYYSLLGISPKQKKYKGSWARVSDHMYSNTEGGFSMRDIKTYLSVAPVLSTLWFGALAGLLIEINRLFPDAFYSYARDRILRDMTKISPF